MHRLAVGRISAFNLGGYGERQILTRTDAPLRKSEPGWFIRRSYSNGSEEKGQEEDGEEEEVIFVARCARTTECTEREDYRALDEPRFVQRIFFWGR